MVVSEVNSSISVFCAWKVKGEYFTRVLLHLGIVKLIALGGEWLRHGLHHEFHFPLSLSTAAPTVSVDWLHANLQEPDMKVLDASWYMPDEQRNPLQEYQAAHIPGALFFDVDGISAMSTNGDGVAFRRYRHLLYFGRMSSPITDGIPQPHGTGNVESKFFGVLQDEYLFFVKAQTEMAL